MSFFDAVNHAMTTLATGGYSTHDASMGFYDSNALLVFSTVFMVLAALPFVIYVRAFLPRRFQLWRDPQIIVFVLICVVLSLAIAITAASSTTRPSARRWSPRPSTSSR